MSSEKEILENIKGQVTGHNILLYMKGSPKLPQCGFSAKVVQILAQCGQQFAYVDVLSNPDIRRYLPKYANWPTFPQLWINGELIGGCDIVSELFTNGELQSMLEQAATDNPSA